MFHSETPPYVPFWNSALCSILKLHRILKHYHCSILKLHSVTPSCICFQNRRAEIDAHADIWKLLRVWACTLMLIRHLKCIDFGFGNKNLCWTDLVWVCMCVCGWRVGGCSAFSSVCCLGTQVNPLLPHTYCDCVSTGNLVDVHRGMEDKVY